MTTKKMSLGELLVKAATPRGKRKPFSGISSLNDRVAYLQHAVKQVSSGLIGCGAGLSTDGRDVEALNDWVRGDDGPVEARLNDMVVQLMSNRDDLSFDESHVEVLLNDAIGVLSPLAEVYSVRVERDQEGAAVPDFQWYFVPGADDDQEVAPEPQSTDAEEALEEIAAIEAEYKPADDGEATGQPEGLPEWHAPRPSLSGDEVIRLGGVDYIRHPLSAAFVDLRDDEIAMLAESLRTGQRHPVVVVDGGDDKVLVVDGWQRLVALQTIEQVPVIDWATPSNQGDLAQIVMALNEHRRGSTVVTTTTRCIKAMELLDIEHEGGGRKPSAKRVAAVAGCSTGTVEQIRRAIRWDRDHDTDYFAQMERGALSATAVNIRIAKAEQAAKQGAPTANDAPATTPKPADTPKGIGYDADGKKKPRSVLVDELAGALEDEQIQAEQHAQEMVQAKQRVAEANQREQVAKEQLARLTDTDETAKHAASLEEQNAALRSQVAELTDRLADALRDAKRAQETVDAARQALHDGAPEDLYDALGVEMTGDIDEEVFA